MWRENLLGYLSVDIICPEKRTKTVTFEGQIICRDQYLGIFSSEMEAIVFIVL